MERSSVTCRRIPPEEWHRLREVYESNGMPLPPAERNSGVIAEVDGQIVGHQGLHTLLHAGPLWVAPEWRGRGVSDGMNFEIERIVREMGASAYFMFPSNAQSENAVRRFGLSKLPWQVFVREVL